MFNKKRLRNYGLWVAVIALDVLIYRGVIPASESEHLTGFAQRGLELLVLLGILSKPDQVGWRRIQSVVRMPGGSALRLFVAKENFPYHERAHV